MCGLSLLHRELDKNPAAAHLHYYRPVAPVPGVILHYQTPACAVENLSVPVLFFTSDFSSARKREVVEPHQREFITLNRIEL